MRSLLVLLLVAFGVSGAATAQTAEFKCPAVGNQYDFKWNSGRITRYTSQGREGTDCAYMRCAGGTHNVLEVPRSLSCAKTVTKQFGGHKSKPRC